MRDFTFVREMSSIGRDQGISLSPRKKKRRDKTNGTHRSSLVYWKETRVFFFFFSVVSGKEKKG